MIKKVRTQIKKQDSWTPPLENISLCKLCTKYCKEPDNEDTSECIYFIPINETKKENNNGRS